MPAPTRWTPSPTSPSATPSTRCASRTSRTWCCRTCALGDLWEVYQALEAIGLAEANAGLATDIIACPGLDYCALANARSIPIAQRISERLAARQDADRRPQDQDLRLHQRLRPPPRRPHRHPGRREARRGALPAPARRLRRGGCGARPRSPAPASARTASSTRWRRWSTATCELRAGPDEPFLAAYGRLGAAPFKEALYAAA